MYIVQRVDRGRIVSFNEFAGDWGEAVGLDSPLIDVKPVKDDLVEGGA
jgi:hypothetical protein